MCFESGVTRAVLSPSFPDCFNLSRGGDINFNFDGIGEPAGEITVPGFQPFNAIEITKSESE